MRRVSRFRCSAAHGPALLAVFALGCAQVLGIPTDPELVPSAPLTSGPTGSDDGALEPGVPAPDVGGGQGSTPAGRDNSDGVLPAEDVVGLGGVAAAPDATSNGAPDPSATPALAPGGTLDGADGRDAGSDLDAGAGSGAPALTPEPTCSGDLGQVPIDIVMVVDNSGSMVSTAPEIEQALPAFAARLDELLVDYRVILLTGHRSAERGTSQANDVALCVAAPLGGLATCPSPAPAPGPRFFHYGVTIGATSSFAQVLATIDAPDSFGLTSSGWSEWLRVGARKIIVEISDSDSDLPSADFVSGLAAASPEHFSSDSGDPGFVFHGIVGLRRKALVLDLYAPDEPIEVDPCTGTGSNPANAGEIYQQLSRATGGLRQSICPASVMNVRLQVLADDIAGRSVVACPQ